MKLTKALICALLVAGPAAAQRVNPDRVIDFHINMEAQNQSFGGSVREGTRFNLSIRGEGDFALVPVVTNAARQELSISVLRLDGDAVRTLETVSATVGEPAVLRTLRQTTIVVEELRLVPRQASAATATFAGNTLARRFSAAPMGTCCITCGSVTACACAVRMDCGSCCSDDCCRVIQTRGGAASGQDRTFAQLATPRCNRPIPAAERRFTPAPGRDTRLASSR